MHQDDTATPLLVGVSGVGHYDNAGSSPGVVTGIRALFSTGDVASGNATLYKLRKV